MWLALDLDGLEGIVSDSGPWLALWSLALAATLFAIVAYAGIKHRRRSPVEKMLRRRFG